MTPQEAARIVDNAPRAVGTSRECSALNVLIDHARATAAPGDLAGWADRVDLIATRQDLGSDEQVLRDLTDRVRAHRCAEVTS